ncbi:uncharacterized skeletal organic matrix protein 5-like [Acropora millepora]|uniref:uncharacterized skeletal organic matrix protein 5-like n=1 Tax=Acropora millepora TaxID=45264 RepID=UPI001CF3283C|nr:uncharacterized skeletal organic matrix protein 5-like [Acropora millepora]
MKILLEKGTNIFHSLHRYSAHSSRTTRKGMEEEQGGIIKLFTLFLLIPHLGVLADKQCESGEFLTPEKTLKNHNFRSVPVGGPLDCHLLCKKDPKCQSYNFMVIGNICELNNSTKEASPRDLVRDDARFYMGMKHAEGQRPQTFSSCRDIYRESRTEVNGNYLLQMPSGKVSVYCHMSSQGLGSCSGGGWTLVMKIDGRRETFTFSSKLWSNYDTWNILGGRTGFDSQETKLPTYWNTPFTKICLAMKIGQQMNFITINRKADSLHSLIADGEYRATTLGRDEWKSLIGTEGSLQRRCNKQGFNPSCTGRHAKARIGIVGNNENDCGSCDSFVGFGGGGHPHYSSITCGNSAIVAADNGDKKIKAMGYILVQ